MAFNTTVWVTPAAVSPAPGTAQTKQVTLPLQGAEWITILVCEQLSKPRFCRERSSLGNPKRFPPGSEESLVLRRTHRGGGLELGG